MHANRAAFTLAELMLLVVLAALLLSSAMSAFLWWQSQGRYWRICYSASPDGKLLATSGIDANVELFELPNGQKRSTLIGHSGKITSLAFSADGRSLASASADATVKLWDIAAAKERTTLGRKAEEFWCVAVSPDGQTVATVGGYDRLWNVCQGRLWRANSNTEPITFKNDSDCISSLAFSPDGSRLASGSLSNLVDLWDVETGELKTTLGDANTRSFHLTSHERKDIARSVVFSRQGNMVAAGILWNVKLWNVETGAERELSDGQFELVTSVAFSTDGKLIASAYEDSSVKLWDAATGELHGMYQASANKILSIRPDSRAIYLADDYCGCSATHPFVEILDLATGACRTVLHPNSFIPKVTLHLFAFLICFVCLGGHSKANECQEVGYHTPSTVAAPGWMMA